MDKTMFESLFKLMYQDPFSDLVTWTLKEKSKNEDSLVRVYKSSDGWTREIKDYRTKQPSREDLQAKLQEAVSKENYKEAAIIQAEIKKLEQVN